MWYNVLIYTKVPRVLKNIIYIFFLQQRASKTWSPFYLQISTRWYCDNACSIVCNWYICRCWQAICSPWTMVTSSYTWRLYWWNGWLIRTFKQCRWGKISKLFYIQYTIFRIYLYILWQMPATRDDPFPSPHYNMIDMRSTLERDWCMVHTK